MPHPPPRSGVSPIRDTRVTTDISSRFSVCASAVGFRPDGACPATRGLGANPGILPYALPGSDPPAGTARRSIELEESATSRHLLQPGRVGTGRRPFLAFVVIRPEPALGEDVALSGAISDPVASAPTDAGHRLFRFVGTVPTRGAPLMTKWNSHPNGVLFCCRPPAGSPAASS